MRSFSLKARMSFSVMAILFVILAGLGVWQLQYFETSYRQLIAEQQSTLVRQIAGRIDTQLRDARDLVAAIAGSFPIDSLHDADLAQAYLDTQLGLGTTTLFNNGIFLFTADGRLLAEYPYKPDRRGDRRAGAMQDAGPLSPGPPGSRPRPAATRTAPVVREAELLVTTRHDL
jgi:two-component system NtrC family sensor kinase